MVYKKRWTVHTQRFKGKFARLQMKPSLALYYVYTGFIY